MHTPFFFFFFFEKILTLNASCGIKIDFHYILANITQSTIRIQNKSNRNIVISDVLMICVQKCLKYSKRLFLFGHFKQTHV